LNEGTPPPPLLEVAVALPVRGTFTYRDPRAGGGVPVGAQVVVPFGHRTVTGFVVAHAAPAAAATSAPAPRDIEAVVAGEPAFDEGMIGFCRFVADYYQAPLGEVLRAALPQGEKAQAVRAARLTERGRQTLDGGQRALPGAEPAGDPVLAALAAAGGELPLARLTRRVPRAASRLARLVDDGLVEVGDEVQSRRPPPTVAFAVPSGADGLARLPARAAVKRALYARVAAAAGGMPVADVTAAERAHLRAMEAAGVVRIEHRPAARAPGPAGAPSAVELNAAQAEAVAALEAALARGFSTVVLHGVTGSGKTEVYLRAIAVARERGRGALVLVPEIALTPQLAARFRARFGEDVAVLHSALPPGERLAAWRRLRAGEVGIALGARSAVFAPVRDLGIVVVDEEHDPSFKQEEGVRYHGRDLAIVRAQRTGAVVVLGSATPSLETIHNAGRGRFALIRLPERATPRPLPEVRIVDLRRDPVGPDGLLSAPLAEAVAAALAAREQVILFLNRRGFSTVVLCRACGHVVRCENCSVSMTYHRGRDRLVCHYCARTTPPPARCPSCTSPRVERLGTGTERVEAVLKERFPEARVFRLDRDTVDVRAQAGEGGGQGQALEDVLRRMQRGEIDLLVGTQMVTKGHDFAGVTLVGVLQPDQGIHLPDFRAAERTFQLLEQVAGRAGRGDRPGRVIVQTYSPEHPAIAAVQSHDYAGFVGQELAARKAAGYPPYARMIVLRLDAADEGRVKQAAADVAGAARAAAGRGAAGSASGSAGAVRVQGPAEAPIPRVRGRSRWQVWLAGGERAALAAVARAASAVKLPAEVRLTIDVDPQSVL
jgi:primosomal protein N' (replication factor Y)